MYTGDYVPDIVLPLYILSDWTLTPIISAPVFLHFTDEEMETQKS